MRLSPTQQEQDKLVPSSALLLALFLLDLEGLRPQLRSFSAALPRGTPPPDPIQRFRSLLCLTLAGETASVTKWVAKLRSQPFFAALSGFARSTPGIGTFYDFTARLYPETTAPLVRQALRTLKASDTDHRPRPGIVQHLVTTALAIVELFPTGRIAHFRPLRI